MKDSKDRFFCFSFVCFMVERNIFLSLMDTYDLTGIDESIIKSEKAKARKLRKSRWWHNKIASGICYFCRKKFPPAELTMDHLQPLARGGTSSKGNLVPACKECNSKKKNLLPLEWEEYMEKLAKDIV